MLRDSLDGIRNALGRLSEPEGCVGDLPELASCVTAVQQLSASVYLALASDAVTFVDRNAAATPRVLGPWSEEQLCDSCPRFLMLCLTLFLALSGFLADEVMEQIANERPGVAGG